MVGGEIINNSDYLSLSVLGGSSSDRGQSVVRERTWRQDDGQAAAPHLGNSLSSGIVQYRNYIEILTVEN